MNSPKLLWLVITLLSAIIITLVLKFIVLGSTTNGTKIDERTQIELNASERYAVLFEMRSLLEATQQIISGLANNDMQKVAQSASAVGMQATSTMDVRLMAKLPLPFKQMGMGTHQAFDEIADMAKQDVGIQQVQRKLAETMNNCIACHASYQIPSTFHNKIKKSVNDDF